MKVFVTGGAGYIGSITVEMLLNRGCGVTVFDNLERGHREALDPRASFVEGDLRRSADIERALAEDRPDAVIHFAAYALVGESMQRPEAYFGNNVRGGVNLCEAMLKARVRRIVFSSTCASYGQPEKVPISEAEPQRPENPYGDSKLMLETMLDWYRRLHGFSPVFLRYFNACGASGKYGEDHDPETHLIPNVLKTALGRAECVNVFGDDYDTPDGTCVRDYVHILDLADAHITALELDLQGAFNLGTGRGYSVMDVVNTARAVTGREIPVRLRPRREGDPPRLVADASLAREKLNWRPRHSDIETIVRSAWTWHRAHPRGYAGAAV